MKALATTPILNVASLPESFAWFEQLGWRRNWDHGDPPTFGAVGSGVCEIFLCQDGQGGRGEAGAWVTVWVDDVDAIYATCLERGIEVAKPPVDEPWGVRELHLRHPDGHTLRISRGSDPHDHDHPHPHDHPHDHDHDHPH